MRSGFGEASALQFSPRCGVPSSKRINCERATGGIDDSLKREYLSQ